MYGLPELFRKDLVGAKLIATPGCYVTTATLALAPLLAAGLVEPTGIVVDAASGVSGAGRPPKPNTTFCTVDEDFTAYGVLDHRHTPEIEQNLTHVAGETAQVIFTPHLAPMNRGILATCYARPTQAVTTESLRATLHDAYDAEPFVVVRDTPPSTKATLGSQQVHVTAYADERTGWVVAIAALDNLTKGASGGAIQAANVALGLEETAGLPLVGIYPLKERPKHERHRQPRASSPARGWPAGSSPRATSTCRWSRPQTVDRCRRQPCSPTTR